MKTRTCWKSVNHHQLHHLFISLGWPNGCCPLVFLLCVAYSAGYILYIYIYIYMAKIAFSGYSVSHISRNGSCLINFLNLLSYFLKHWKTTLHSCPSSRRKVLPTATTLNDYTVQWPWPYTVLTSFDVKGHTSLKNKNKTKLLYACLSFSLHSEDEASWLWARNWSQII